MRTTPQLIRTLAAVAVTALAGCRDIQAPSAAKTVRDLRARFPAAREALAPSPPGHGHPVHGAVTVAARPETADGPLRLAASGVVVEVRAPEARSVAGADADGARLFHDAYPDTDVVQVSGGARHEELLSLRGPAAPRRFEYQVRVEHGRLSANGEVLDDQGVAQLRVARPWALDARGHHVDAALTIDGERLVVELDPTGLVFPVLLDPAWESTVGASGQARFDAALALLGDGRVLSCGGTIDGATGLSSCDRYDPASATWSAEPGAMAGPRLGATMTWLTKGALLVCGGGTASCETYDPALRTFAPAPPMGAVRSFATATLLADGKVLMAGGEAAGLTELYDPAARSWSSAGSIAPRARATAARLGNGKILVVGGAGPGGPVANADLYDPGTGAWTPVNLPGPRAEHTATRLRSGGVLVAGGTSTGSDALATALVFDEAANTWVPTAAGLPSPRRRHTAALLPSGKVLLAGGSDGVAALASADLFDGLSTAFWRAAPLGTARDRAAAVVLPSGDVLLAGGQAAGGALASSERYAVGTGSGPATSLALSRVGAATTPLRSGKVLVSGGLSDPWTTTATAEVYDPALGAWAPTGVLRQGQYGHAMVELTDGGVLLAPGWASTAAPGPLLAETWDSAAGQWSTGAWSLADAGVPQAWRSAVVLRDGRVLTVAEPGGASLFDPTSGALVPTAPLNATRGTPQTAFALTRSASTLTLLSTGKVLLAGGVVGSMSRVTATCELFDPAAGPAGTWSLAGPMAAARAYHAASSLPDGRVLVAGGHDGVFTVLGSAELFDPATSTWSPAAPLRQPRSSFAALTLPSGRVLALGGTQAPTSTGAEAAPLGTMELYDSRLNRWLTTTAMVAPRSLPLVANLPTGAVLIAGGLAGPFDTTPIATAEAYRELVTGWTPTGAPTQPFTPVATAPLPGGKVLVLGVGTISSAEIYDPSTGTFSRAAPMGTARTDPGTPPPPNFGWNGPLTIPPPYTATLLSTGKVLVAGGGTPIGVSLATAELYDPVTNSWTPTAGPMGTARAQLSAAPLLDGRVLLAGGTWWNCPASFELFDPATGLFTSVAAPGPLCTHHLVPLADGRVLADNLLDSSVRIYDPSANAFTLVGYLRSSRRVNGAGFPSATLLPSGKVLFAGGLDATAELFDPSTGSSTYTGSMSRPRSGHTATLLPTGKVLVAQGGTAAELYDPQTGTFSLLATSPTHEVEVAALLPSGAALLVGTVYRTAATEGLVSDLGLDAPVLARPVIATAPAWAAPGDLISLTGAGFRGAVGAGSGGPGGAASDLPVLTLLRADGTGGLRRFQASAFDDASLTVTLPTSLGVGSYFLFVTVAGTPSVAAPMRIGLGTQGGACTADAQCASGHCVNQVCCAAACPACQACNLAPTPGTCLNVAAGAEDGRACTITKVCDGTGACRLRTGQPCAANGDCQGGFCVDGACCQNACAGACQTCNLPGSPGMCLPSPAGKPGRAACSGTSSCDGAGNCKKGAGQACAAASECALAACADGVCCDVPCTGACLACNTPQHLGACSPAPRYSAKGCLATQACDGVGACKLANGQACTADAACASGLCADGVCCAGACGPCQACNLAGTLGTCANVASGQPSPGCAAPSSCDGQGRCLLVAGKSCASASQCASAFCADGVCCDAACSGPCQACNLVSSVGTCTAVGARLVDPDSCTAPKACDGAGACKLTLAQGCTSASACLSGFCAGGLCCDSACTATCQSCSLSGSLGTCAPVPQGESTATCAAPRTCDGAGACKLVLAQACTASSDCLSGNCADGFCCDTPCAGTCQACNLPGRLGQCSPVARSAADPDTCAPPAVCDGAGACLRSSGQACAGPAECLSGSCIDGACCTGACAGLGQPCTSKTSCASGRCVDGVCCAADCTGACMACNVPGSIGQCTAVPTGQQDLDTCAAPNACDGAGACAMKPVGRACGTGRECQSGHCVDGLCCDTSCTGTCVACDVAGRQGTCSSVPRGSGDKRTCVGAQACDGAGACLWLGGQPCGDGAQCVSGACSGGVCCENACTGQCRACNLKGQEGTCAFVPSGEQDKDCSGLALACDGSGRCKARNGVPCTGGAECASGQCVDGLCCDSACAGSCMACGVAGHLGVCTPVPQGQTFPGRSCDGACDGQGTCKRASGQGCAAPDDCASGYCEKGACAASGPAAADPNLFSLPRSCGAAPDAPLWVALGALGLLTRRRRSAALLTLAVLVPALALAGDKAPPGTFTVRRKPAGAAQGASAPTAPLKPTPMPVEARPPTAERPAPPPSAAPALAPTGGPSSETTPAAAPVERGTPSASVVAAPPAPPSGASAPAASLRVAFLGMQAGGGVGAGVAELVESAFLASIQERPSVKVVSTRDIQAMLTYERQRQLVGCSDSTCLSEIGDVLGVDRILNASLGKVGETLVFGAQLFNPSKAQVDKRYSSQAQGSGEEALLDMAADAAVGLFGPSPLPREKSSAGRVAVEARVQALLTGTPGGAVVATAGYRVFPELTLSGGVLVNSQMGLVARVEWVPFNAQGRVRPVLALEVPLLFARSVAVGIGGSVGVQFTLNRWLSVGLAVPGTWLLTAPSGAQRAYLFAGPTVAARL